MRVEDRRKWHEPHPQRRALHEIERGQLGISQPGRGGGLEWHGAMLGIAVVAQRQKPSFPIPTSASDGPTFRRIQKPGSQEHRLKQEPRTEKQGGPPATIDLGAWS